MGDEGRRGSKVALKTAVAVVTNGRRKMIMAKEMSNKVQAKRREKKRRDLAPKIGAKNVDYWGIDKHLVKKMKPKRGNPCTTM